VDANDPIYIDAEATAEIERLEKQRDELLAIAKRVHKYAVERAKIGHALPDELVGDLFDAIAKAESPA
jgi:hypothetical protein